MHFNFERYDKLIDASNLEYREAEELRTRLIQIENSDDEEVYGLYQMELDVIKHYLIQSMLDPITHGRNYNQTDILNHLKKLK